MYVLEIALCRYVHSNVQCIYFEIVSYMYIECTSMYIRVIYTKVCTYYVCAMYVVNN